MLSVTPGKKCCIIKSMSNKKEVVVNFNDSIRFCSLIYNSTLQESFHLLT